MSSGVTAQTWANLIIDVGVVYANYGEVSERIIGATNGGVSFGWEEFTVRQPEIDGLKGHIKGATRITRAIPQMTVNLVEWTKENVAMVLPAHTATTSGTGADQIVTYTRDTRLIPEADYLDNVAIVGTRSDGEEVIVLVKNALVTSGVTIPMNPDSESTVEIVFVGHYDSTTPEEEPWEIRYPDPNV